ncbi:hypothetical protein ACJZ2D_005456 [Fusarium nematophilum]
MGLNMSKSAPNLNTKKGKGRPKTKSQRMIEIHFLVGRYLKAKIIESGATTVKEGTAAVKNMVEAGDCFLNGRVHRQELKANGEAYRQSLLAVQAPSNSVDKLFRNTNWIKLLSAFMTTVQLGMNILDIIYGSELERIGIKIADELEARTGLSAPGKFSVHVHKFLWHHSRTVYPDDFRHIYFLYHPDTDWYPEFSSLVRERPLPDNVLDISENLDALVVWMRFIRQHLGRRSKTTMLHLLIPAYRPMLIKDALEFPNLGLFMIHGEIHHARNYIWMNLPTVQDYPGDLIVLKDVGNMARAESEWKDAAAFGTAAGGMTATFAGTIAASVVCPILMPVVFFGGGACSLLAGAKVEESLSKEIPRLLGSEEINERDQASGAGARGTNRHDQGERPINVQPNTRHVSGRRRRIGSHRPGHH